VSSTFMPFQWPAGPQLSFELTRRRFFAALFLGFFGAAANCFELHPFPGVAFAAGALAPLFASFTLGAPLAMAVAFLSYLPTLFLWEQPLSLSLAVCEAGAISYLYSRLRLSPYQAFVAFWVLIGLPVTYAVAWHLALLPEPTRSLLLIKYPLNSFVALLIAVVIRRIPALARLSGTQVSPREMRLSQLLFATYGPVVIAPLLFFSVSLGNLANRRYLTEQERLLRESAASVAEDLSSHLSYMRRAIVDAAADIEERGSGAAQEIVEKFHRNYPAFATMLVADASGQVVASAGTLRGERIDPARSIGTSVADREYFTVPMATRQFFVSNGFKGRSVGSDHIFALSAPIKGRDGRPIGVVEASVLLKETATGRQPMLRPPAYFDIYVVDGNGRVVLTTNSERYRTMANLRVLMGPTRYAPGDVHPVSQEIPEGGGRPAHMVMRSLAPVDGINWDVVVELPLDKVLAVVSAGYGMAALLALVAWVIAILVTRAATQQITTPFEYILSLARPSGAREPAARLAPPAGTPTELVNLGTTIARYNEELRRAMEQRDRANEALRNSAQDLERQVVARTADVVEAKQRAEEASRVKSEFIAHMSHELRTPLNVILGSVQMLTRERGSLLAEAELRRLNQITTAGALLRDLIEDVLDLAKIESGTIEFEAVRLKSCEVIRECVEIMTPAVAAKGHQLAVRISAEDTWLISDHRRLRQILVNLLSNAVKFTPAGGRMEIAVEAGAAGTLKFSVSDNGRGMSAEEQARIFEPFMRGSAGKASTEPGTGLGLALIKRLVEAHGGSISVRSTEGVGTCFTMELPRSHLAVTAAPAAAPVGRATPSIEAGPASAGANPPVAPVTSRVRPLVLIAEDHAPNALLLDDLLRMEGMDTRIATNGVEAVELARQVVPDLILMDWKMPLLEGPEAILQIRAHPRTAAIPIIALTAFAQPQDAARMNEVGANAFLTKPIDFDRMHTILEQFNLVADKSASAQT
jgi:signal transduction histidine kinase/ActR/RegA family two-component response regulator